MTIYIPFCAQIANWETDCVIFVLFFFCKSLSGLYLWKNNQTTPVFQKDVGVCPPGKFENIVPD